MNGTSVKHEAIHTETRLLRKGRSLHVRESLPNATPQSSVLLVSDRPGHILERIGCSWIRHAAGADYQLINVEGMTVGGILHRLKSSQVVHWVDRWSFMGLGHGTAMPQVAMIHHLTETERPAFLRKHHFADAITTASYRWKTCIEKMTGREVFHIPYTVDCSRFCPCADRSELRHSQSIPEEAFVLGFVGKASANHDNRKGIDLCLRILAAAGSKWNNLCLIVVGPGWHELLESVRALGVQVLSYEFATTFQTAKIYPLMDVLLVTSNEEGGPCTILEAMACGVPCVTSDVGHVPEVVRDGETGWICRTRTVEEYLAKLALLRNSKPNAHAMGLRARDWVERERDDHVAIPRVDFHQIYESAVTHYQQRHWGSKILRRIPQVYWQLKHY